MNFPNVSEDEANKGCGAGHGSECCAYLTRDPIGYYCGRTIPSLVEIVEARVEAGTMKAQRLPQAEYPKCQL